MCIKCSADECIQISFSWERRQPLKLRFGKGKEREGQQQQKQRGYESYTQEEAKTKKKNTTPTKKQCLMMCERPSSVSQERFNSSVSPLSTAATAVVVVVPSYSFIAVKLSRHQQQHTLDAPLLLLLLLYGSGRHLFTTTTTTTLHQSGAFQSRNFSFLLFLSIVIIKWLRHEPLMEMDQLLDFPPPCIWRWPPNEKWRATDGCQPRSWPMRCDASDRLRRVF